MTKDLIAKLKLFLTDKEIASFIEQSTANEKMQELVTQLTKVVEQNNKKAYEGVEIIKGEDGAPGIPGTPGKDAHTPILGYDYYTDEERKEFLQELLMLGTPEKYVDFWTDDDVSELVKLVTPIVGVDYFTPLEIVDFKKDVTPLKGKDYFDGKDGTDGSPDTGMQIVKKLNNLHNKIEIHVLKGLDEHIKKLIPKIETTYSFGKKSRGGLSNITGLIQAGAGVSISGAGNDSSPYVISSNGGVGSWGSITGILSTQTDLQSALNAKFDIPTGTTAQYVRGDGSLATLPTDAVTSVFGRIGVITAQSGDYNTSQITENTNLYYTNTRADARVALAVAGTANYIPKFTSANVIGNSQIFDDGTNVGVGTATPGYKLDVTGDINLTGKVRVGGTQAIYIPGGNFTGTTYYGDGGASLSYTSGNDGKYNTAVGTGALYSNTTGYQNSAQGVYALFANTTGFQNSAQGYQSLYLNTTGYQNVAQGSSALRYNTTGYQNSAQGVYALFANTTGFQNSAQGVYALYANTTGSYNSAQGSSALYLNTTGNGNSAQGYQALYANTTGSYNSAQGVYALYSTTTGSKNSAQGAYALSSNTTGSQNSAQGMYALQSNTTGFQNSAQGSSALYLNTTGSNNSAQGYQALYSTTTGNSNSAQGVAALSSNTTGYSNSAQGYAALYFNTTGYYNSAQGVSAGRSIINGNSNTFVGYEAGYNASQKTDAVNSMALGNGAYTTTSNQVVIGNTSVTQTLLNGNVGIGMFTPSQKLDVAGNVRITGAIYDSTNSPGTSGQALLSTVTGTAWTTLGGGSGTVTSVATGTGLTGGPITASGTISLNAGSIASLALADTAIQNLAGLSITATAVELNYSSGVTSSIQTQLNAKGTGTVTSVTSANGALTVATGTTTPVLTVNSAPILTTARTINGVSFNGSANITVTADANTLSGTTLKSTVVASSLTSVGTIATGVWNATAIADAKIASAATWNALPTATSTTTFTNKDLTAGTNKVRKTATTTSTATPAPTGDSDFNYLSLTAQAVNATISAPSGTARDGNSLVIRITPSGTYTLAYNAIFEDLTGIAPVTMASGKDIYIGCFYNSTATKWQITSVIVKP